MCKTKRSSKDCNRCFSIVSKIDISDLARGLASSLIINFEQVIEPFLVLNICFTFFLSVVDCTFYKSILRVTVYYYYVTYASEAVARSCSVKQAFLEILQSSEENACARVSSLKKRLWNRCFAVNFELPFLQNTSGGCFWRFRVDLHSIVLELLARNRRNI